MKLADFGVAAKLGAEKDKAQDGGKVDVAGTPYWMAPEVRSAGAAAAAAAAAGVRARQRPRRSARAAAARRLCAGRRPRCPGAAPRRPRAQVIELQQVTPGADIWSVGCLIIELLTGYPPYYDLNAMSALYNIVADPHPPLPEVASAELQGFLLKCFQKVRNGRRAKAGAGTGRRRRGRPAAPGCCQAAGRAGQSGRACVAACPTARPRPPALPRRTRRSAPPRASCCATSG